FRFPRYRPLPYLHSFPTRRSSDLVFTANRRQDASVVGHLRLYRDLGESTNIDLGASYARGHNTAGVGSTTFDPANFLTNLYSAEDRKSTRLNSSHDQISYAVFCLK